MNNCALCPASRTDTEALVQILHDADESDARIRAALNDDALHSYAVYENEALVGAAVVCWAVMEAADVSELVLLAVAPARRGEGIGKWIIAVLISEARRCSVRVMQVGTGNFSLDNIAFYQKCGFRMSHVRRGYFDDVDPPEVWQGIKLRDMIVFDYDLTSEVTEL